MTADRYIEVLAILQLGHADVARLLNITSSSSRRYANGIYRIPPMISSCLEMMVATRLRKPTT